MAVYLDLLIVLNFWVDLLLIMGTNRLSGYSTGWKRAIPAAALGGLYAGACVLPGFSFLSSTLWRMVALILMSILAFGLHKSSLRRGVLFLLLSMALGGIALGLESGGFWALVLSAAMVCLLCVLGFRGRAGQQQYLPVTICLGEKSVALTALADTGTSLRDPISGWPVLVVDSAVAGKLLGLSQAQIASPLQTLTSGVRPGLRLIPYTAVGQPTGLLLGTKVDHVILDGREVEYIVACAPQILGHGQYQALAGGVL